MSINTANGQSATSVIAVIAGLSLHDLASLLALIIAIISGLMAIRNYYNETKYHKMQIQKIEDECNVNKTKGD